MEIFLKTGIKRKRIFSHSSPHICKKGDALANLNDGPPLAVGEGNVLTSLG